MEKFIALKKKPIGEFPVELRNNISSHLKVLWSTVHALANEANQNSNISNTNKPKAFVNRKSYVNKINESDKQRQ